MFYVIALIKWEREWLARPKRGAIQVEVCTNKGLKN